MRRRCRLAARATVRIPKRLADPAARQIVVTDTHQSGYRQGTTSYGGLVGLGRTLACSAGCIVTLVVLGACSSSAAKNKPTRSVTTVIVTASPTTSAPPSTTAAPKPVTKLRATCETVLTKFDVNDALGVELLGKSEFVIGTADRTIGRLGYINCRYGVGAGAAAVPPVEVGVSLYNSAGQAARRAASTVDDYRNNGATPASVTVAGHEATILSSTRPGYDIPLLVLSSGQRTVAVSIVSRLVPPATRNAIMTKIANLVVTRTGG